MFHRLYETPADQGSEAPVAEAPVEEAPVEEPAGEAPVPESYTREQIAEALGPHWERFGQHEGLAALQEFARSHDHARSLISRGGHLEPQDPSEYEALGIEPPVFEEPEQEPEYVPPIYGAPWVPPENWDQLIDLAQPVRANGMPGNPRAAYEFVANRTDVDDATKAQFFANFAVHDPAGWTAYQQSALQAETERRMAEYEARIDQRLQPIEMGTMKGNAQNMLQLARETIPGFHENREATLQVMSEKRQILGQAYDDWFFNATIEQQVQEMHDLTGVAIFRAQPALEAEDAEDAAATEQAKVRARTETGRFAASPTAPAGEKSEMKKKFTSDFQRLKDQGML
jgi:hypothetical protein